MSKDPNRKTIIKGNRVVGFEYPEHYTDQQRGITDKGGYLGAANKVKSSRIQSPQELAYVSAASNDIGTITRRMYSKTAFRRVPKSLRELYGLPLKDKRRSKSQQEKFLKSHK